LNSGDVDKHIFWLFASFANINGILASVS